MAPSAIKLSLRGSKSLYKLSRRNTEVRIQTPCLPNFIFLYPTHHLSSEARVGGRVAVVSGEC